MVGCSRKVISPGHSARARAHACIFAFICTLRRNEAPQRSVLRDGVYHFGVTTAAFLKHFIETFSTCLYRRHFSVILSHTGLTKQICFYFNLKHIFTLQVYFLPIFFFTHLTTVTVCWASSTAKRG